MNLNALKTWNDTSKIAATRVLALISVIMLSVLILNASRALSENADWLAMDLKTTNQNSEGALYREISRTFFDDDILQTTATAQAIRALMEPAKLHTANEYVASMIQDQEINAEDWLARIPKYKSVITEQFSIEDTQDISLEKTEERYLTCYIKEEASQIRCGDNTLNKLATNVVAVNQKYNQVMVDQIERESTRVLEDLSGKNVPSKIAKDQLNNADTSVKFIKRKDGLITAQGGKITFTAEMQTKKVIMSEDIQEDHPTIFVRNPAIVVWDEKQNILISKKSGETEVFIFTPNRVSIIETKVQDLSVPVQKNLAVNNQQDASKNVAEMAMPSSLVSLDGLDFAATKGRLSANLGANSSEVPDLVVAGEVAQVGQNAISAGAQFVRAKAKVNFESIRIKVVDDRSTAAGVNYPVAGVRVKIAGTDFDEMTNNFGIVEVRDVPLGSRILVELHDDQGHIMPQVSEIDVDRKSNSRSEVQTVVVRRYSSLDFAARSSGVTQNMQKSSFCGAVTKGAAGAEGVKVALGARAVGPVYFNHLGFVDLRMGATGSSGRFCFFNVESGPATIGLTTASAQDGNGMVVGATGFIPGRHMEEIFDLNDARYVSTTLNSVAPASEQLNSDPARSLRADLVDQADVFTMGSGQLMVPVDEGMMTTASMVLPVKGRVWTVSRSSDFETSVQAISTRDSLSRQITTLVPNGFVSDMSEYAQTVHDMSMGSVLVEHGNFAGISSDGIKMRLVDAFGRDVGDGWYFTDQPVAKAIFFNVPVGTYSLIVETSNGHWIAADTLLVYSESLSVVKTGAKLEKLKGQNSYDLTAK